ncbi:TadE/TadG family type IV pilus assembly protein [Novosphingobium sp. FSW06-99]|uniref:TadE/TadG family type IV pilus assembly protein n=1 Tax=Novosphingobium sp. FSW06-99 TaxID=1739113 RepID=UPI00076D074B|nr:TadE family protein [Novosphingobium sp. FSW06-99]KUR75613.1 hypothetical protein AQZ49_14165 [Novosphingobium sp. FSW06-99]
MALSSKNQLRCAGRGFAALVRDRDGTAVIEMAIVTPALVALIVAILQTALAFLAQEGLETAAESAARLLLTGQAQTFQTSTSASGTSGMSGAQFQQAICGQLSYIPSGGTTAVTYGNGSLLPPFLNCSQLSVVVTDVGSATSATAATTSSDANTAPTFTFNSSGALTNNGSGTASGTVYNTGSTGGQGQILVVQLVYLWPTLSSLLGFSLSSNIANDQTNSRELVATQVVVTESYSCPTTPAVVTTC